MTGIGDEWDEGRAIPDSGRPDPQRPDPDRPAEALSSSEIDAAFNELVADWHVDTIKAIRDAEKSLAAEDKHWRAQLEPVVPPEPTEDEAVYLDEFHYIPPAPPPFPKLAVTTVLALFVLGASIAVLIAGTGLGLSSTFSLLLGVSGVLLAAGILFTRLRERNDDDSDGTAV
jgi:hypothetical protein